MWLLLCLEKEEAGHMLNCSNSTQLASCPRSSASAELCGNDLQARTRSLQVQTFCLTCLAVLYSPIVFLDKRGLYPSIKQRSLAWRQGRLFSSFKSKSNPEQQMYSNQEVMEFAFCLNLCRKCTFEDILLFFCVFL